MTSFTLFVKEVGSLCRRWWRSCLSFATPTDRQPSADRALTERQNATARGYQGYSKGIRFAATILVLLFIGVGSAWGAEEVVYTLDGTSTSGTNNYAEASSITQNSIEWSVTGNTLQNPWRIGGKSLSNVDKAVYSKTAISDNVTKIVITHGAASSITVNSMTVTVSKNSDFSSPVSTLTPTFAANKDVTINRPAGKDWSDCYYKIVYNVSVSSGSSNKFVEFTRAKFYAQSCTALGSINGSVSWTNGTQANLVWDNLGNVDATTPYTVTYKTGAGDYVSTNVGSITTNGADKKTCSITELTPGTAYTFKIAVTAASGYCDNSQEITATAPLITASGTITGLNYSEGSGPSTAKSFTVSGVGLTGDITVTAPTDFEVSKSSGSGYGSSVSFSPTSGTLASSTVYVRLAAGKSVGTYGASAITISGGGAADNTSVTVAGEVSVACHAPSISAQPSGATYNLNATATALSVTAAKGDPSDPELTYQWYSNTANSTTTPEPTAIPNATGSTYTPPTTSTGTVYYFCVVSSGICTETSNVATVTVSTPTITVSETSRAFGNRKKDGSYTMTFTVSGSNLAKDAGIALAVSGTNEGMFSLGKTSLTATSNAVSTTTITVTYHPTTAAAHSAQINITSTGATTKTVALSGTDKEEYTITLNPGNGSLSAGGAWVADGDNLKQSVLDGTNVTLPTPTPGCAGWVFQGWKDGSAANNQASFTADRADGATFSLTANKTYYAVYRQSAPSGTSYDKITSVGDLTTGNYVIKTSSYAMKNTGPNWYTSGSYWYMSESSNSGSGASITNSDATITWTIIKFGDSYAIKNGTKYLGIDADGNFTFDATPHLFSATYDGTNSRWIFTSATYISYQIIYNYYFRAGTSQSTAILLYKQRSNPSGNYYTSPTCTSYAVSGAASPVAGGSVSLSATTAKNADVVYAYASPNSGYKFTGWAVSGTGATLGDATAQLTTITVGTADVTVTASFGVLRTITLTGSGTVANGTFSADMSSACAGETVTLTATPDTHYSLGSWTVTGATSGNNITVTNNQFIMPDENVTINATMSEDPYRMVVFKNDGAAVYNDGGDASAVDATNKWKQKVYVGEAPVWPTKLDDSEACDATSNKFYGWATNTWSDVLADADALAAWDGGTVYTSGPLANVTAGTGDVVYHAVWAKASGSNGTISIDESGLKTVVSSHSGTYAQYNFTLSDGDNDYTITASKAMKCTDSGTAKGWPQIQASTGIQIPTLPGKITNISSSAIRTASSGSVSATAYFNSTASTTSPIASCSMSSATSFSMDINTSASSGYLLFGSAVTLGQLSITYDDTEYSNFLTSCCANKVTLSEPVITDVASSGSTVTFTESSAVATCDGAKEVHVTITPAAGYQATSISFGGTATQTGVSPAISTPLTAAQTYTISYAQDINGTLVPTVTFEAKPLTSWTWTYNSAAIPNPVELYVGEKARFDVTYTPSDIVAAKKTYSRTKDDTYMNWYGGGIQPAYFQCQGKASTGESTTAITLTHDDGPTQTINVKVKALPTVTFVDHVHNKVDFVGGSSFTAAKGVLQSAVSSGVVTHNLTTPTHADLAVPGSGNDCELSHLHLVGWIESSWADEHPDATHSDITNANTTNGAGTFFAAGASIDVDAHNGKTFYAVWSKIE